MHVCVTGFGKFNGVEVNPTTLIVGELAKKENNYSYDVLEVSVDAVNDFFSKLEHKHTSVYIHLGVHSQATRFNLEQLAYNCMTFRVPDERGFQPTNICICDTLQLHEPLKTGLSLDTLKKSLEELYPVEVSTDPGRFLCNYTYFKSLERCGNDCSSYALFVHVPPVEIIPLEVQIEFVESLIKNITDMLSK